MKRTTRLAAHDYSYKMNFTIGHVYVYLLNATEKVTNMESSMNNNKAS